MTPEELLKPRWKVIADYPNSPFKMWDIANERELKFCIGDLLPENFPSIFKLLNWWEGRAPEDMPDHVKSEDKIIKVSMWAFDTVRPVMYFTSDGDEVGAYVDYPPYYTPATESEYNEYLKQQNG